MPEISYRISLPLALARGDIDRCSHLRSNDHWWAITQADPRAQAFVVADGYVLVDRLAVVAPGEPAAKLVMVAADEAPIGERFFLGLDPNLADVEEASPAAPSPARAFVGVHVLDAEGVTAVRADPRAVNLREIATYLSDRDAGLLVHAVALAQWHLAHERCARCGDLTEIHDGGHVRKCPACGASHFPRTDPAVIMLVLDDDDRALLGRQMTWPQGRYSTLAGFVEPGESPEQAVVREVAEESAVVVDLASVRYAGSQPWPFPSSLMLGFYARATTTQITVDDDELSDARWFTRAELAEALASGEVIMPTSVSIARRLVEGWFEGEQPGQEGRLG